MYKNFFGFSKGPFSLTPDPAFLYMALTHWEAFSTMMEGIRERKGIIAITGDVGTGKTTLIYTLLKDPSDQIKTAFISNPLLSFNQLLKAILWELKVPVWRANTLTLLYKFDEYIREKSATDETVVILIDEAQNIRPEVLTDLDRLLQRDAAQTKVLQTLLVGQLELEAHLDPEELKQFKHRIAVQRRIRPLSREESEGYIDHRLKKVGSDSSSIFTPAALQLICHAAKGIPRVINLICDGALIEGYNNSNRKIGIELVRKALVKNHIIAGEEAVEAAEIAEEEGALQREKIAAREEPSAEGRDITAHEIVAAQGARAEIEEIAEEKPAFVREAAAEKEATDEIMVGKETMGGREPLRPREAEELRPDRSFREKIGISAAVVSLLAALALVYWSESGRFSPKEAEGILSPAQEQREKEEQKGIPKKEEWESRIVPPKEEEKNFPLVQEQEGKGVQKGIPKKEEWEGISMKVETGWTLSFLARRHYGTANPTLVDLILVANPRITDVNRIQVNQAIRIPRIKEDLLLSRTSAQSYRIHLGTFADQSQVQIFQNETSLGWKKLETLPRKVSSQETWYQIFAGEFKNEEEAVEAIQALKQKGLLPAFSGRASTQ
jgi:general secretion pathway protein A